MEHSGREDYIELHPQSDIFPVKFAKCISRIPEFADLATLIDSPETSMPYMTEEGNIFPYEFIAAAYTASEIKLYSAFYPLRQCRKVWRPSLVSCIHERNPLNTRNF
jgi:hypothetical protein